MITGATSGIGYELAKVFAENNYNLVLVARSEEDLEHTADELRNKYQKEVVILAKDLFDPEAAFELYHEVKSKEITINILVNNAGQGVYGKFFESDIQQQLMIIQLNVSSLTALTYLFLKDMVTRNEGKILQLASIASEVPHPLMSVYGGTKAYILSFSEALSDELKGTNVTVTALLPGATDTDFFNKAKAQDSKIVKETKLLDPAVVARTGFKALIRGDSKVVAGLKYKAQSAMSKVTPDPLLAKQMRSQLEESEKKT